MPLLSIIVPNYNNEKYLGECLESILEQTFKDFEVLVIDDCSTDGSRKIIKDYAEKDERIQPVFNRRNMGVARSRDKGIRQSIGKYICTLDSDDIFLVDTKLEKEIEVLKEHSMADNICIFSGVTLIDEHSALFKHQLKDPIYEGDILSAMFARKCFVPRDFLFSKAMYYKVGGYNFSLKLYEDWDLKLRLAKECKYFFSGISGIGYRRTGEGLSAKSRHKHVYYILKIWRLRASLLPKQDISNVEEGLAAYIIKLKKAYHLMVSKQIENATFHKHWFKVFHYKIQKAWFNYRTKKYQSNS